MITLDEIIQDFIEVAIYHNKLPKRNPPPDEDFIEELYLRTETIKIIKKD